MGVLRRVHRWVHKESLAKRLIMQGPGRCQSKLSERCADAHDHHNDFLLLASLQRMSQGCDCQPLT